MAMPPTPPCSPPSALSLVCLLTLWLVPWMQRAVAVLPVPGTAWWAAARTAALESGRSSTTVLPFFVAIGLVAVLFDATSPGLTGMRLSGFLVMFGLALLVAWSGGVAVIAMSAGRWRRDAALLRAARPGKGAYSPRSSRGDLRAHRGPDPDHHAPRRHRRLPGPPLAEHRAGPAGVGLKGRCMPRVSRRTAGVSQGGGAQGRRTRGPGLGEGRWRCRRRPSPPLAPANGPVAVSVGSSPAPADSDPVPRMSTGRDHEPGPGQCGVRCSAQERAMARSRVWKG